MRLTGRTALVTGGCGGTGRAIVGRFLREGATVYVAARPGSGPAAADEDGSRFLPMHVTSEDRVAAAMDQVRVRAGQLDVLVDAAGSELETTVADTMLEERNRSSAVSVTGTLRRLS